MADEHEAVPSQHYSDKHKIPSIAQWKEKKARDEEQSRQELAQADADRAQEAQERAPERADEIKKSGGGAEEKKKMMEQMQPKHDKPTDRVSKQGERTVHDPVTGVDVIVKDAEFEDYKKAAGGKAMDADALDPKKTQVAGISTLKPPTKEEQEGQAKTKTAGGTSHPRHVNPAPASPGNILLHEFPPPIEAKTTAPIVASLNQLSMGLAGAMAVIWFFTAFGHGYTRFMFRTSLIVGVALAGVSALGVASRKIEKELERVRMDLHRQRGENFSPPTPESVEWLNGFIKVFWGMINPSMFAGQVDMVEDIMMQSLPGFISSVKISDYGQGSNPFRIISMRALPDQPGDKDYPKEEWIDQGDEKVRDQLAKDAKEGKIDADQTGDYVNYEVSWSYQAMPGQGSELRTKNIHLQIEFYIGVYDWFHIPIPIWIQVEGLVGTARLRLQFIPEAPYIRNLTFTLMGTPGVDVSAIPMTRALPNILDLPLVTGFVKSAIAAATSAYVAPQSMTMNMQEMLTGAGVPTDTHAIGVFLLTIHHAENLSAQDSNGKSDPYIVAAYAKFGKPLYSTRIIMEDLNPVFEETFAILLSKDELQAKEDFSLMLWDSDARSADDLIGRIQMPVEELIKNENKFEMKTEKLRGFEDADDMPGTLTFSIGYFTKTPYDKRFMVIDEKKQKEIKAAEEKSGKKEPEIQPDIFNCGPDPDRPSGILSLTVHQINNLERQNLKGASGSDREGKSGQDTADASQLEGNIPSPYVEFVVNDTIVYKTRVKPYTTFPFFEAGTEIFIKDWQNTIVRLVTRDSRLREHDPILGIVTLDLREVFQGKSTVNGLFSLQEGVGFGKLNCSALFRSIEARLPTELIGWDTGTVEILSDVTFEVNDEFASDFAGKSLSLTTSESSFKVSSRHAHANGRAVVWELEKARLPVYNRYSSAVSLEVGGGGILPGGAAALAALWLQDLVDDDEKDVRIPVVMGNNLKKLRQHYMNNQLKKTHEYEIIGYAKFRVKFDSGLDEDHEKYATNPVARHELETYMHIEGHAQVAEQNSHAMDDGVIDKDEAKAIKKAKADQLHSRQRGSHQFQAVRTGLWAKDGIKKRTKNFKNKITGHQERQQIVKSEA
ncbi:uncharacterized protein L969DRAFT_14642 [Mixia osmundae IAM 14324]|nr:uncharacterized protein L969DRAFT_14642 [Mixia osmundae IAM 14324]KEI42441.1 hypothetical protein L969DRAFT_14642 [Mixia osmundae IAM 14324]